jgi:hypothetical protein
MVRVVIAAATAAGVPRPACRLTRLFEGRLALGRARPVQGWYKGLYGIAVSKTTAEKSTKFAVSLPRGGQADRHQIIDIIISATLSMLEGRWRSSVYT